MDTLIMPPRFVSTPSVPFHEEERDRLAHSTVINIRRLLGETTEQTIPLATTPVGTITAENTGDNGFIITVERAGVTVDLQASSVEELQQLPLEVLGQIWQVSNDIFNLIARKHFTGKQHETFEDNSPLPSTDPDDPMLFNDAEPALPAFLTDTPKEN